MSRTIISIENISKLYRLGEVGTGTLSHDLNRWWARVRGKEDPYSYIGQVNTRESNKKTDYVWALKDINLEISEGEVVGIIGRNGAGKSTLLKLISRIMSPTSGTIRIRGRVGSLLEVGTGMHSEMTARENIYLNGAILGMKKHEIQKQFDDIVEFSGCALYVDTPIKRFSTGMRVRLGFSVAAFLNPEILIVDEVLAVGDLQFQKKCLGKMEEINNAGRTILFVSHNMATLKVFCRKGVVLEEGRITCIDSIDEATRYYTNINSSNGTLSSHYVNETPSADGRDAKAVLQEMMITDSSGRERTSINVDEAFNIHIKLKLNNPVPFLRVAIEIVDVMGTTVLMSEDTDSTDLYGQPREPGYYHQTVNIPAYLLMPRTYSVNVFAGMPRIERLFEANHKIRFEIEENNTHLSSVPGAMRSGYIAMPLQWEVAKTDV